MKHFIIAIIIILSLLVVDKFTINKIGSLFSSEGQDVVNVDDVDKQTPLETTEGVEEILRDVQKWNIVSEKSSIQFQAVALGKKFIGQLTDFNGEIFFDPNNLEESYAKIKVKTGSVDSQDSERDEHIKSADWFYITSYPEAIFETIKFEAASENDYVAVANLTIRDVTMPVAMPFSVEMKKNGTEAHVKGRVELNRLSFGLGQGEWEGKDSVDTGVIVAIDITAKAQQ